MKVVRFEIANFKGISATSINLSDEIPGNVIALIGLNESGNPSNSAFPDTERVFLPIFKWASELLGTWVEQ